MEILKLYKAIESEAFDARARLDRAIDEAVLNVYRHGYKSLCIVRWQRVEAGRFVCAGQVFTPDKEKQARDLAAEMQGTLEIVEFKKAIPAEQLTAMNTSTSEDQCPTDFM